MKRWMVAVALLSCAAVMIFTLGNAIDTAHAKHWGYSNADFMGCYAVQLTGHYVFPADSPLAALNGPFAVNGRVCADGQGRIRKTLISNFNGQVYRAENVESSYEVRVDGTFTETFVTPFFGGAVATITYEGVLLSEGDEARMLVSGFSISGVPPRPGQVGMVIAGSLKRQ
jgi:hypothetical protein